MGIRKAEVTDLPVIRHICGQTISEIYPHYYPKGAVAFFLALHNEENILKDIRMGCVFLCDTGENVVGTVTVRQNEICRLFVLPVHQGKGYGRELLDFAERMISGQYPEIILDASLPAKSIYLKRGYRETAFHSLPTDGGDFLCYDEMKKNCEGSQHETKRP